MTNSETTLKPGDTVRVPGQNGTWLVKAVDGERLTVTNPHTHSGRTYLAASRIEKVES